jgi:hypothetical protein
MSLERDINIMGMFLVMAQEVIDRFKRGQRLTMQEKMICLMFTARTMAAWENVTRASMSLNVRGGIQSHMLPGLPCESP